MDALDRVVTELFGTPEEKEELRRQDEKEERIALQRNRFLFQDMFRQAPDLGENLKIEALAKNGARIVMRSGSTGDALSKAGLMERSENILRETVNISR